MNAHLTGCNLIPSRRIYARRRARRVRLWLSVVPGVASLLMGVYAWLNTAWTTDTAAVQTAINEVDRASEDLRAAINRDRAQAAQSGILLAAHKAVGEQPDWGILLYILSAKLGDDTVLSNCVLEPMAPPGARALEGSRPTRFRLTLFGIARDQDAVSRLVLSLESEAASTLFDQVRILESKRINLGGRDAIGYRIECHLSDGAAGGGAH